MANERTLTSIGITGREYGLQAGDYHPTGVAYANPGVVGREGKLTPEQQEVALDVAQITLDLVGIFEPTPFADGANALISIGRGDWLGAGLSGLGIIPYLGDLAKAGKLPGYAQKLHKAIDLARRDAHFAQYLRPALQRLKGVLDSIPDNVSRRLRRMIDTIRIPLDSFLGTGKAGQRAMDIESLTDRLLMARLGSTKNVGTLVRKRVRTIAEFLQRNGVPEEFMLKALSGIDVHSPVEIITLRPGDVVVQYVDESTGVGNWFVKAGSGTGPLDAGIARGDRATKRFQVTRAVELIKSKSAPVVDTWTPNVAAGRTGVRKPNTSVVIDDAGMIDIQDGVAKVRGAGVSTGVVARGGGEQMYLPSMERAGETWRYNKKRFEHFMRPLE